MRPMPLSRACSIDSHWMTENSRVRYFLGIACVILCYSYRSALLGKCKPRVLLGLASNSASLCATNCGCCAVAGALS